MSLRPRKVDFNDTWSDLKKTIDNIIKLKPVPRSVWNDKFSDIYSLCVACPDSFAELLYDETKKFIRTHLIGLHKEIASDDKSHLLADYAKYWKQYNQGIDFLNKLYTYLNSQHIKKSKHIQNPDLLYGTLPHDSGDQMKELGELGLELWVKDMIEPLQSSLVTLLLDGVKNDRTDIITDQKEVGIMKTVISSFVVAGQHRTREPLKLYQDVFEEPYLKSTGDHYRQEANDQIHKTPVSQYMEKVLQRREEEKTRCWKFLHESSYAKVSNEIEQRMVADHLTYLQSTLATMVSEETVKDLANAYQVLKTVQGGLNELVKLVEEHIKKMGREATQNVDFDQPNAPITFVEAVLEIHNTYANMISSYFHNDQHFTSALGRASASVVNAKHKNRNVSRSAELLAKYCDTMLRKSARGTSDSDIDDKLAESVTVFKYLDDKDLFQRHYAKLLAKRLIYQSSASMDAEEAMINRFKQACGYEFTNKLHRLYTDQAVSTDLQERFMDSMSKQGVTFGHNVVFNIMQQGAWPFSSTPVTPFILPQPLEKSVSEYEAFYRRTFNGRKLTWMYQHSLVDVRLTYLKRSYIATVFAFQYGILSQFETADEAKCSQLQEATNLNDDQFARNLYGLLEQKILLSDKSDLKDLSGETVVRVNLSFASKKNRFKVPIAQTRESQTQETEEAKNVDEDRKNFLQAAIVRIMKSRKSLKHNALVQEVVTQARSRFAPNVQLIKRAIEGLIEKEYIQRSTNNPDEYNYIA
ncbi:cullin-2-like [Artemia franciscana]|uniref:Cullin-2 n=1 Tax=Artemia franciscana TaxID=6661 RepID=A0AA88I205_ARTSF|nr:hypothetical protein QYM36_004036 [Artemia franciscana]KAK2719990.1 hypothetical protein QYM36_004036 [Artemia franciscana]